MTIDNSFFDGNDAGTDPPRQTNGGGGGAIYNGSDANVSITATGFRNNTTNVKSQTGIGGGAIFNNAASPFLGMTISSSAFAGNIAMADPGGEGNGGAIFNNAGGNLSVAYSHFGTTPLPAPFDTLTAANEAQQDGAGGAIYSAGPTLILAVSLSATWHSTARVLRATPPATTLRLPTARLAITQQAVGAAAFINSIPMTRFT